MNPKDNPYPYTHPNFDYPFNSVGIMVRNNLLYSCERHIPTSPHSSLKLFRVIYTQHIEQQVPHPKATYEEKNDFPTKVRDAALTYLATSEPDTQRSGIVQACINYVQYSLQLKDLNEQQLQEVNQEIQVAINKRTQIQLENEKYAEDLKKDYFVHTETVYPRRFEIMNPVRGMTDKQKEAAYENWHAWYTDHNYYQRLLIEKGYDPRYF